MTNCCICMEEINDGEGIELIECGHDCFHPQCIMQWFRTGFKRCPVCNDAGITKDKPKRTGEEAVKLVKARYRKGQTNDATSKLVKKLYKTEATLAGIKKQITAMKSEEGVFRDLLKKQRMLWSRRWALQTSILDLKRSIVQICEIRELIIITKKEVGR